MGKRRCLCGAILALDNTEDFCSPCQLAERMAEHNEDRRPLVMREALSLVDVFSSPEVFSAPEVYLAALTWRLKALCAAVEREAPDDIPGAWEEAS